MSHVEKYAMRQLFPSRNTFNFENGLRVTSDFDAGNLQKCFMTNKFTTSVINELIYGFELWISSDSHPYMPQVDSGKAGFFFAITGIPEPQTKYDEYIKSEV